MSKANAKNITTLPKLRPYEQVPFIVGMSPALRSLFNAWQEEVVSHKAEYRRREKAGATNKQLDATSNRSRRVIDKIERKIFGDGLSTMHDALAIARFAAMLNKGMDFTAPVVALRRIGDFVEATLERAPPAIGTAGSTLAPLYSQLEQARAAADAMSAAGNDDAAEGHDRTRDKIVDLIAGARATTAADMLTKLRVLRWSTSLLVDSSGVEESTELRMIDGLISDIEGRHAAGVPASDPVIALLAEWAAAEAEIERTRGEDDSPDTDEHEAAWERRFAIETRIKATPASSHAGILGKLRLAASYVGDGGEGIWESAHRDAETLIGPHLGGQFAAVGVDDPLVELWQRWLDVRAESAALPAGADDSECGRRLNDIEDEMGVTPAISTAGLLAKARLAGVLMYPQPAPSIGEHLACSLAHDIERLCPGLPVASAPARDGASASALAPAIAAE